MIEEFLEGGVAAACLIQGTSFVQGAAALK